jgi:hypothetical protein
MLAKQAVLAEPSEASTARPKGPVPNPSAFGRRRLVTSRHKSPPLLWSGGCHMLAKQAVLAEPTEASTARPEGPVPPAAPKGAAAAATAQRTGPPLRGALSWARGVLLALLPRCARKHVAPAGLWPAASCDIPTQNAAGLSSAASCDIPAQIAAAPLERRVPHACAASSASRTIRSVDSAPREARRSRQQHPARSPTPKGAAAAATDQTRHDRSNHVSRSRSSRPRAAIES